MTYTEPYRNIPIRATFITATQGTWTHGRVHTPKTELTVGRTAVSSAILETSAKTNVGQNMQHACTTDIEDVLMFETFKKIFKKQVVCGTANN
jgi:hypothetical protein